MHYKGGDNKNDNIAKGSIKVIRIKESNQREGKINYNTIKCSTYIIDMKLIATLPPNKCISVYYSHSFTCIVGGIERRV